MYFRASTRTRAKELGIVGTVKNLPNGSVEITGTADKKTLDVFEKWCYQGSPLSKVDAVECRVVENLEFEEFSIQY